MATKFKAGDKVIGNDLSNDLYRITNKGWRGTVLGYVMLVRSEDGGEPYEVVDGAFDLDESEKEAE